MQLTFYLAGHLLIIYAFNFENLNLVFYASQLIMFSDFMTFALTATLAIKEYLDMLRFFNFNKDKNKNGDHP
jgi:hypothetical protein